jgi:hypothetical protein
MLKALDLDQLLHRIGAVLVVFPEHGAGLRAEGRLGVLEILEAVRLDAQDGLEVFLGEGRVVVCVVVGGVRVLSSSGASQDRLVLLRRVALRPAEHHVLEEVRKARLARLDLIARASLNGDLQRDEVGEASRDDDHLEAVGERPLHCLEWQDVATGRHRRAARRMRPHAWRRGLSCGLSSHECT